MLLLCKALPMLRFTIALGPYALPYFAALFWLARLPRDSSDRMWAGTAAAMLQGLAHVKGCPCIAMLCSTVQ